MFLLLNIITKSGINIVKHVSLLYVGASFGYMSRSGIAGSSGRTISNFLRNWQIVFQSSFYQLAIPPAMEECSSFSPSLPASAVTCVFDLSHSNLCFTST